MPVGTSQVYAAKGFSLLQPINVQINVQALAQKSFAVIL
jgi:hypothetical protein